MRYVLYHADDHKVSLQGEIEFMKNYIDLMSIRIAENITVKFEFPEIEQEIKVPPLLFISLIENAYKHGIDANFPGFIHISMEITTQTIIFKVNNTLFPKPMDDQTISGIGLENLNKRLQLLYKDMDVKLIREQTENEYHTELKIPKN
jgi:LytS/YehU family sensor histidine kinase